MPKIVANYRLIEVKHSTIEYLLRSVSIVRCNPAIMNNRTCFLAFQMNKQFVAMPNVAIKFLSILPVSSVLSHLSLGICGHWMQWDGEFFGGIPMLWYLTKRICIFIISTQITMCLIANNCSNYYMKWEERGPITLNWLENVCANCVISAHLIAPIDIWSYCPFEYCLPLQT